MLSDQSLKISLRERKKIKTRAAIQQHALRLFREQGYQATTIEQIAEVAEISPSTIFRYFPTKEALVLEDDYDPIIIQYFQEQPIELSPIQAFRNAIKLGFSTISKDELGALRERMELLLSVPELRAASQFQMMGIIQMISELMADRVGLEKDNFQVLVFAGAIYGAIMSTMNYYTSQPDADLATLCDEALTLLEAGLPLISG
ncbi:MAG: TetR family transcriptional regulator [Candidatus Cohnella colombiensis]|uniref:TetR family transcriptional regulator n=1 Tax=Candidatus Cohnella colombiensis TaxID=3121368 RepID=A0AA95EUR8_9BACL|nr:MAG: TetR family transcriptional regulator [Cohnella sp.]